MPSSVIQSYSYDEAMGCLDVLFVSGILYSYADVPKHIVGGLEAAPSKGSFFNERIRDHYAYRRRRDRR